MKKEYGDNELVPVRMGEKFGYVNLSGEVVIPAQFDGATWFRDGLARVECKDMIGFIDKQGVLRIPCRFANAYMFDGEYCMAAVEWGCEGLINRKGDFVVEPIYQSLLHMGNGICVVVDRFDMEGIVSPKRVIIEPQFDRIRRIGNAYSLMSGGRYGLANNNAYSLMSGGRYGLANNDGVMVFPKYNEISLLYNNIFSVRLDGKYGLIDINGKSLTPIIYEEEFMHTYGFSWAYTYLDGHRVFLNDKGEQFWKE